MVAACGMALARQAHLAPYRTAIIARLGQCIFGELNAQANQLVRALPERSLGEQSSVALIIAAFVDYAVRRFRCKCENRQRSEGEPLVPQ